MDVGSFPEKLKERREGLGLTQKELAKELGLTKGRISQWEKGDIPPLDKLIKLAAFFGVDIRELLKELGVITDAAVEVTPDERKAIALLRTLPEGGAPVALQILGLLTQLQGGKVARKPRKVRPTKGAESNSEAAG